MAIEGVGEVFAKLQGMDSASWNVFRIDKRQEVWTSAHLARECPPSECPPWTDICVAMWAGICRGQRCTPASVRTSASRRTALKTTPTRR